MWQPCTGQIWWSLKQGNRRRQISSPAARPTLPVTSAEGGHWKTVPSQGFHVPHTPAPRPPLVLSFLVLLGMDGSSPGLSQRALLINPNPTPDCLLESMVPPPSTQHKHTCVCGPSSPGHSIGKQMHPDVPHVNDKTQNSRFGSPTPIPAVSPVLCSYRQHSSRALSLQPTSATISIFPRASTVPGECPCPQWFSDGLTNH